EHRVRTFGRHAFAVVRHILVAALQRDRDRRRHVVPELGRDVAVERARDAGAVAANLIALVGLEPARPGVTDAAAATEPEEDAALDPGAVVAFGEAALALERVLVVFVVARGASALAH